MDDYRWRVIATLLEGLRTHAGLVGVQVEAGDPGSTMKNESIWIDAVGNDGTFEIPVLLGDQPVEYVDEWLLPVNVVCKPNGKVTSDDVRSRLGELVAPIVDFCRDNPGLVDAELVDTYLVESLLVQSRSDDVWRTEQGPMGQSLVTLVCRSRLTTGDT